MLERGCIVRSLRGRDAGKLLAVVGGKGNSVLVCDGKERKLEHPKSKNPKHIAREKDLLLSEEWFRSNPALRRAIRRFEQSEQKG